MAGLPVLAALPHLARDNGRPTAPPLLLIVGGIGFIVGSIGGYVWEARRRPNGASFGAFATVVLGVPIGFALVVWAVILIAQGV